MSSMTLEQESRQHQIYEHARSVRAVFTVLSTSRHRSPVLNLAGLPSSKRFIGGTAKFDRADCRPMPTDWRMFSCIAGGGR